MTDIVKIVAKPPVAMGIATVSQILGEAEAVGVSLGISQFNPGSMDWELTYDEGIFVLDGQIEIVSGGVTHQVAKGEFLWMPKGRTLTYRAESPCSFLYIIPARMPVVAGG